MCCGTATRTCCTGRFTSGARCSSRGGAFHPHPSALASPPRTPLRHGPLFGPLSPLRCFIALPHYLELTNAERVDLSAPERPLESAFKAARDAGEEGLMVKAADKPYAPNARNNVLKLSLIHI